MDSKKNVLIVIVSAILSTVLFQVVQLSFDFEEPEILAFIYVYSPVLTFEIVLIFFNKVANNESFSLLVIYSIISFLIVTITLNLVALFKIPLSSFNFFEEFIGIFKNLVIFIILNNNFSNVSSIYLISLGVMYIITIEIFNKLRK